MSEELFILQVEQKFSLGGVQCKKICSHLGRNSIWSIVKMICWRSESEGRKELRAECHLRRGDG